MFALFAPEARKVYDPLGDQTLDELEPQVFGDQMLVRPARNLANLVSCSGQPVYFYRLAYVDEVARGKLGKLMDMQHAFRFPCALNAPAVPGEMVTPMDEIMAGLVSNYWTPFGKTNNPNRDRPIGLRYDQAVGRILHKFRAQCCDGSTETQARLAASGAQHKSSTGASA